MDDLGTLMRHFTDFVIGNLLDDLGIGNNAGSAVMTPSTSV